MAGFPRMKFSQINLPDYATSCDKFTCDQASTEELINILNQYGNMFKLGRRGKRSTALSQLLYMSYLAMGTKRNAVLIFDMAEYFEINIWHTLVITNLFRHQDVFFILPKIICALGLDQNLKEDLSQHLRLLSKDKKNSDERVEYLRREICHPDQDTLLSRLHRWQYLLTQTNELWEQPESYFSIIPRDIRVYILEPYVAHFYLYLN